MYTKLTLRLNKEIIEQMKVYALMNQKSLSALTEELYKKILLETRQNISGVQTPMAKKYKGILGKKDVDFDSIKLSHLKEKHLK
jgi:hypothetical protein